MVLYNKVLTLKTRMSSIKIIDNLGHPPTKPFCLPGSLGLTSWVTEMIHHNYSA